jgi:ribosomal subunit interface protein
MTYQPATVQLTVRGNVPDSIVEYTINKMQHVVGRTPDRIQQVHVVLSLAANPAHEAPADIDVEAVLGGASVHVHSAAATLTEAADEASDRLQRQLTDLRERGRSRRRSGALRRAPTTTSGPAGDLTEEQEVADPSPDRLGTTEAPWS